MTDRIDHSRPSELDEILARIDHLISPASIEHDIAQEHARLELFRQRFEHVLSDLDLPPACGIAAAVVDGTIAIRARNRRAAEILLRVLERHADHHRWGSTRW